MKDVPDDRDVQLLEPAERFAHRVQVEQRLRRMLVLAVTGVDDVGLGDARDELRSADVGMADDDDVGVVCTERDRGVLQRFALVDGRAARPPRA